MLGVETTSSENQAADSEFRVYALGFCYASVCSSLDPETTRKRLEAQHPTFGETWRLAEEQFRAERDHAHPCDQAPATHKHYLFRRQDESAGWDASHPGQSVQ
jgi:hypothetical protein